MLISLLQGCFIIQTTFPIRRCLFCFPELFFYLQPSPLQDAPRSSKPTQAHCAAVKHEAGNNNILTSHRGLAPDVLLLNAVLKSLSFRFGARKLFEE